MRYGIPVDGYSVCNPGPARQKHLPKCLPGAGCDVLSLRNCDNVQFGSQYSDHTDSTLALLTKDLFQGIEEYYVSKNEKKSVIDNSNL